MEAQEDEKRASLSYWGYLLTAMGFVVTGVSFVMGGLLALGPPETNIGVWLGITAVVLGGLILITAPH